MVEMIMGLGAIAKDPATFLCTDSKYLDSLLQARRLDSFNNCLRLHATQIPVWIEHHPLLSLYILINIHIHIHMHKENFACMFACMYICMYVGMHVYMYGMYVCVCSFIYIYVLSWQSCMVA